MSLVGYNGERCPECHVHPSVWKFDEGGHPNAIGVDWVYCRVCELLEIARKAGPPQKDDNGDPAPGWRLELQLNTVDGGG